MTQPGQRPAALVPGRTALQAALDAALGSAAPALPAAPLAPPPTRAAVRAAALALAQRNRSELSFVMLDLDHFKAINDSYGHPAGDRVLLGLSRLLQQRLRSTDIVGRYGGEEFAIALHSTSKMQAQHLLNSLREDFNRLVFYSGEQEFRCSFSAGIATYPQYQRLETLRQAADDALYRAKHQGRNCVVVV